MASLAGFAGCLGEEAWPRVARREIQGAGIKGNLIPICLSLLRTITSCSIQSPQQGPGQSLEVSIEMSPREGEKVGWASTVRQAKERLGCAVRPGLKAHPSYATCCVPFGELTSPGLISSSVKWG